MVHQFDTPADALAHYGVKGMKWGVRKDDSAGRGAKTKERGAVRRGLTKWNEAGNAGSRVLNDSTNRLKAVALPAETRDAIRADMGTHMLGAALGARSDPRFKGKDLKADLALRNEYRQTMEKIAQDYYSKRLAEEYGLLSMDAARHVTRAAIDYNKKRLEVKATKAEEARHNDDDPTVVYELEFDDKGFIVGVEASDSSLAHYGVKGMKWGVRKDDVGAANRAPGVSRKVDRDASKDAKEFARAKMFYGEGAGTRRKLIKAKVESKSKSSSEYKKAFDHHVSTQDLGKHSTKAVRERKRKDVTNTAKKTTRSTWRALNNGPNVTIAGAVVAAMIVAARRGGLDKIVFNSAKVKYSEAKTKYSNSKAVNDLLKDLGMK